MKEEKLKTVEEKLCEAIQNAKQMDVSLNELKRNAYNFIRGGKLLENVIELQNVSKSF